MAELPIPPGGTIVASSAISASKGPTVTANTVTNTKGAWTQLIASTAQVGSGLIIHLCAMNATATVPTVLLVDIGFGAAASEVVVIPNLACGLAGYATYNGSGVTSYFFPITIPASTRIAARYQGVLTSNLLYCSVDVIAGGTGMLNGSGTVEAWGPDTSTSKLIELDAGGVANTKGSYLQLIASTARKASEITIVLANPDNDSTGSDQVAKNFSVDIAIGAAASEIIIVPDLPAVRGWSMYFGQTTFRLPITVPAGTRISARCSATTIVATPRRSIAVAAYGCG